ncbi:hypothetical protein DK843_01825 [Chromobacterium phragmitis]|uniref:Lcl C-terminal domain-containing protein n=2 Tax=Chromobacterium phragmitis TaxID=2202141 RepID=A0A344UD14_9NEIS|nr:hypothetical protein DK843_01825 [Chromobacterium phragmitis]
MSQAPANTMAERWRPPSSRASPATRFASSIFSRTLPDNLSCRRCRRIFPQTSSMRTYFPPGAKRFMKKSILFPAACSLLAWLPIHAFGGDCDTSRRASTPSSRFAVDGEEVRDKRTGLVWLRCSVGQRWDGKRCFGEIRLLRHQEARRHAAALGHGWRVPAIEELAGIVERRCQNPAINRNIFPDVAELYDNSAKYWSDTR